MLKNKCLAVRLYFIHLRLKKKRENNFKNNINAHCKRNH